MDCKTAPGQIISVAKPRKTPPPSLPPTLPFSSWGGRGLLIWVTVFQAGKPTASGLYVHHRGSRCLSVPKNTCKQLEHHVIREGVQVFGLQYLLNCELLGQDKGQLSHMQHAEQHASRHQALWVYQLLVFVA